MRKNKKHKTRTTDSDKKEDVILLKKLPGLLALCEFILIPFLIVSSPPPGGVAHDNARSAGVYPPQGGTPQYQSEARYMAQQDAALQERTISPATQGKVQIAIAPEPILEPKEVMQVTVTAYSSTKDQTDDTPFHTANGNQVSDGIVAANFLPLGTKLRIPEVFGDKIFTVEDRMHERFDSRIDIWMPSRKVAQEFGIRYLTVEIL